MALSRNGAATAKEDQEKQAADREKKKTRRKYTQNEADDDADGGGQPVRRFGCLKVQGDDEVDCVCDSNNRRKAGVEGNERRGEKGE